MTGRKEGGRGECTTFGEFAARHFWHDRGLDAVRHEGGRTRLVFDLYHCDDPHRCEDDTIYSVIVSLAQADCRTEPPGFSFGDDGRWGSVLDARFADEHVTLVVSVEHPGPAPGEIVSVIIPQGAAIEVREDEPRAVRG